MFLLLRKKYTHFYVGLGLAPAEKRNFTVLSRRDQGPALRYPSKEPVGAIHESPGKKYVILSEVAERHEVEGSVSCDAMHRAAFGSRKRRILRLRSLRLLRSE